MVTEAELEQFAGRLDAKERTKLRRDEEKTRDLGNVDDPAFLDPGVEPITNERPGSYAGMAPDERAKADAAIEASAKDPALFKVPIPGLGDQSPHALPPPVAPATIEAGPPRPTDQASTATPAAPAPSSGSQGLATFMGRMRAPYDEQIALTRENADLQRINMAVAANEQLSRNAVLERDLDAHAKKRAIDNEQFQQRLEHYDQARADLDEKGINAKSYWEMSQVGPLGKVGGPIAMLIGAVAGGVMQGNLRLSSNPFFDHLDKVIARDIDAQKENLASKHASLRAKGTALAEWRKNGLDDQQAELAEKLRLYDLAGSRIQALQQSLDSPIQQNNLMMAAAELEKRRDEMEMRLRAMMQRGGAAPQKNAENIFMGPNGQRYVAKSAHSREVLTKATVTYSSIVQGVADYKKALSEIGPADLAAAKLHVQTPAMARAYSAYNHVLSPMRQAQNDGVWKKGEQEMLENTLSPPDSLFGDTPGQADVAQKQAGDLIQAYMHTEDPLPIDTAVVPGASGRLEQRGELTGEQMDPQRIGMPSGAKKLGP